MVPVTRNKYFFNEFVFLIETGLLITGGGRYRSMYTYVDIMYTYVGPGSGWDLGLSSGGGGGAESPLPTMLI